MSSYTVVVDSTSTTYLISTTLPRHFPRLPPPRTSSRPKRRDLLKECHCEEAAGRRGNPTSWRPPFDPTSLQARPSAGMSLRKSRGRGDTRACGTSTLSFLRSLPMRSFSSRRTSRLGCPHRSWPNPVTLSAAQRSRRVYFLMSLRGRRPRQSPSSHPQISSTHPRIHSLTHSHTDLARIPGLGRFCQRPATYFVPLDSRY
jgi:hypothetical protein